MRRKKQNWVRRSTGQRECIEAFFHGAAYAPHRHDTYTFALTTHGIQSFNYRGAMRHSERGNTVILHPDEQHDGRAGTDLGFGYRSICISPSEIQEVLGGRTLPFIKTGVSESVRLRAILNGLLSELDHPLDTAEQEDMIFDLATELALLSGEKSKSNLVGYEAVKLAQDYIHENLFAGFSLPDLETHTDQDRWQISRDFRALLGTSPYRYLVMRRLDEARRLLLQGYGLADAAHTCCFSDQSHFNRHFRKTYGISPKAWLTSMQPLN